MYTLLLVCARPQPRSGLLSLLCMQTVVASNLHPGDPTSRTPAFIETRSNSAIPQPHTLCPRVIKLNHKCGNFLVSTSQCQAVLLLSRNTSHHYRKQL